MFFIGGIAIKATDIFLTDSEKKSMYFGAVRDILEKAKG